MLALGRPRFDGRGDALRDRRQVRASGAVVFACVGDGVMQMNGPAELITVAEYWRQWSDARLVVFVLDNRDLSMVTREQRVPQDDPKFADPDNPPLPPHVTPKQARDYVAAVAKNDPDALAIVKASVKQMFA